MSIFSCVGIDLNCELTGAIMIYHDQISTPYKAYLAPQNDGIGVHEAKVGDNILHQNLPPI